MVMPVPGGVTGPVFVGTRGGQGYGLGLCGLWLGDVWLFTQSDCSEWIPRRKLTDEEIYDIYQVLPKLHIVSADG